MLRTGLVSAKALNNLQFKIVSTFNQVKWDTALFLVITPLISAYGLYTTPIVWQTCVFSLVCGCFGLISMTTVYHRMYSHRSCKICRPIELFLMYVATADFSMSAFDWVRDHRAHHRYTDTPKDPYNIKNGFWYAHVGWLLWNRERPNSDLSDIEKDPHLIFQHEWFNSLAFLIGWGIPMLVCGLLWDDWRGGFFIAAVLKTVIQHHCIFCINSLAHYMGDGPFNEDISPRDNLICAILTMGEGYHNYHHEFPTDYRNGVALTAWDPTKWLIATLEYFGLATEVKRTSADQVRLSRIQMIQRRLEREKKGIFTGKPIDELPCYTREQVAELCSKKGEQLVIEGDLVYDVSEFAPVHPGGSKLITNNIGKDITKSYNGAVYAHSNAAKNLLQTLRCGRLQQDSN